MRYASELRLKELKVEVRRRSGRGLGEERKKECYQDGMLGGRFKSRGEVRPGENEVPVTVLRETGTSITLLKAEHVRDECQQSKWGSRSQNVRGIQGRDSKFLTGGSDLEILQGLREIKPQMKFRESDGCIRHSQQMKGIRSKDSDLMTGGVDVIEIPQELEKPRAQEISRRSLAPYLTPGKVGIMGGPTNEALIKNSGSKVQGNCDHSYRRAESVNPCAWCSVSYGESRWVIDPALIPDC